MEHGIGSVAGDPHGDGLGDARPDHVSGGSSPEVVEVLTDVGNDAVTVLDPTAEVRGSSLRLLGGGVLVVGVLLRVFGPRYENASSMHRRVPDHEAGPGRVEMVSPRETL
jgi:hypothetical protein